jgi:hypothetical protein
MPFRPRSEDGRGGARSQSRGEPAAAPPQRTMSLRPRPARDACVARSPHADAATLRRRASIRGTTPFGLTATTTSTSAGVPRAARSRQAGEQLHAADSLQRPRLHRVSARPGDGADAAVAGGDECAAGMTETKRSVLFFSEDLIAISVFFGLWFHSIAGAGVVDRQAACLYERDACHTHQTIWACR